MSSNISIFSASKWSVLAEIASKGITPIVFIILARLLSPKDFGVVAIATMVISFSQIFWDAGLSKALIQRQGEVEKTANIVFWTNFILGIFIYLALFIAAGMISSLFEEPLAQTVIKVLGIQVVLASLCSVQTALLQKELNFKKLFYVRFLTSTLPGLASIPLALWGFGYWALVAGNLVGAIGQLVLLWLLNPWRPQLAYDTTIAKQLFSFGIWVCGSAMLVWMFLWVDSLLVGIYFNSDDLGVYRLGQQIVTIVFAMLVGSLMPVIFSYFSRLQNDMNELRLKLTATTQVIGTIALSAGVAIFFFAGPLASFVFGQKWEGIGLVIGVMALSNGLTWLVGLNTAAYKAMGRSDIETKVTFISLCIRIPVYLISIPFGIEAFIWARLPAVFLGIINHLFFLNRYLKINFLEWFRSVDRVIFGTLVCIALYSIFLLFKDKLLIGPEFELIFKLIIFLTIYGIVFFKSPWICKFLKRLRTN